MKMSCIVAGLLVAGCLSAQEARPVFEAASIKPNTSVSGGSQTHGSKGQVLMTNQTLKRLIERAYEVKPFQVVAPAWAETERFDIAAKFPEDTKDEDRTPMLRNLLEDRFKLAVHHETKEMAGYELVVAKSGFKLKPVEPQRGSVTNSSGGAVQTLTVKHTPISLVADLLSRSLGEMVVDRTGTDGVYDFEMKWRPDQQTAADKDDSGVPSLFTAVEETLGLRLKAAKVPVEIVVVDHVERMPIEN